MGTGMSLCLTKIGAALGNLAMLLGILVGVAGMVLMALAFPLYNRVLKKQREKIAPQILHLSDELLNCSGNKNAASPRWQRDIRRHRCPDSPWSTQTKPTGVPPIRAVRLFLCLKKERALCRALVPWRKTVSGSRPTNSEGSCKLPLELYDKCYHVIPGLSSAVPEFLYFLVAVNPVIGGKGLGIGHSGDVESDPQEVLVKQHAKLLEF